MKYVNCYKMRLLLCVHMHRNCGYTPKILIIHSVSNVLSEYASLFSQKHLKLLKKEQRVNSYLHLAKRLLIEYLLDR